VFDEGAEGAEERPEGRKYHMFMRLIQTIGGRYVDGGDNEEGGLFLAARLHPRTVPSPPGSAPGHAHTVLVETDRAERIVVKKSGIDRIRYLRRIRHHEDPMKEVAKLRFLHDGWVAAEEPAATAPPNPAHHVSGCCGYFGNDYWLYNCMPCAGSELFNLLHDPTSTVTFTEPFCKDLLKQTLEGLQFIHGKGVAHLDISLENLLWNDANNRLTIIDFGQASLANVTTEDEDYTIPVSFFKCGKLSYLPPEVHNPESTIMEGTTIDIWHTILSFYLLVVKVHPYGIEENEEGEHVVGLPCELLNDRFWYVVNGGIKQVLEEDVAANVSDDFFAMCNDVFKVDWRDRSTVEALLESAWLNNA
jgi:serine/threonine protein kinase